MLWFEIYPLAVTPVFSDTLERKSHGVVQDVLSLEFAYSASQVSEIISMCYQDGRAAFTRLLAPTGHWDFRVSQTGPHCIGSYCVARWTDIYKNQITMVI